MSNEKIVRFDVADNQAGGQRRPFAKAVRAGDFVYVSGQVPTVDGEVVVGNIVAQTEQVIANIKAVLELAGCTLADVVKVNAWLDDARDFSSFNAVFQKHFIDHPPAPLHRAVADDGGREGGNGRHRLQAARLKSDATRAATPASGYRQPANAGFSWKPARGAP